MNNILLLQEEQFKRDAYKYYNENISPIQTAIRNGSMVVVGSGHNDDVDAFRHAYVSGRFQMKYGESVANILGMSNEIIHWNSERERNMDLWNNAIGRQYGAQSNSSNDLARFIKNALDNDELITTINQNLDSRQYYYHPTGISFVDDGSQFSVINGNFTPLLSNAVFRVDENGRELLLSEVAVSITTPQSEDSGSLDSQSFITIVNNSAFAIIDNAKVLASDLITQTAESANHLASFLGRQMEELFSPFFNSLFSNEESSKDSSGQTSAQILAGSILADLVLGKDITEIAQNHINQTLIANLIRESELKFKDHLPKSLFSNQGGLAEFIAHTINGAIIRFAIMVAADHRMDSDEYAQAAVRALGSILLQNILGNYSCHKNTYILYFKNTLNFK
jgi:hypothetical protein